MRRTVVHSLLALLLPVCASMALAQQAGPIPWRQHAFFIPFRVNRQADAPDTPVEVRLYVRTSPNGDWKLKDRVNPKAGGFTYHAPHDGEYWFSLRSVDRAGRETLDDRTPPLHVVVDTLSPQLELKAVRGSADEVLIRYRAIDPHLNGRSLKIEYQAGPKQPWRMIPVQTAAADEMRNTLAGQNTAWLPFDVTLRATVADRAGNPAVTQVPVAFEQDRAKSKDAEQANVTRLPAASQPAGDTHDRPASEAGQSWGADQVSARPLARDTDKPSPPVADRYSGSLPPQAQAVSQHGGAEASPPGGTAQPTTHPPSRLPAPPQDARSRQFANTPRGADAVEARQPPQDAEAHWVASNAFELEYAVEALGPANLTKVELWGTRDGGQTWSLFATDPDRLSPIQARVDAEGLYGFRIVVRDHLGRGAAPPRNGDRPEVWIGVDQTRPVAQLVNVRPGAGAQAGQMIIRWQASDAQLGPRPIALSYSGTPGGPWSPIAENLENSGHYVWQPGEGLTHHAFLRLQVRDRAGNVGVFETVQPVSFGQSAPQGRIRNVRPIAPTSAPGDSSSTSGEQQASAR